MRKNIQKAISLAMIAVMVVPVAACGGGDDTPSAEVNAQYEWLSDTYKDTSDLTSWGDLGQTKQLSLTAWNTLQQGGFKEITASNDVVYPEIKRVTGVTIDEVFDNNGNNADVSLCHR